MGGPRAPYLKGAVKDKLLAFGMALYVHGLTACLVQNQASFTCKIREPWHQEIVVEKRGSIGPCVLSWWNWEV